MGSDAGPARPVGQRNAPIGLMIAGERNMIRLLAAAVLLMSVAAPAVACDWMNQSASTATQPSTVASQPNNGQTTTPPPAATKDQAPS